jgi:hypothetical protein
VGNETFIVEYYQTHTHCHSSQHTKRTLNSKTKRLYQSLLMAEAVSRNPNCLIFIIDLIVHILKHDIDVRLLIFIILYMQGRETKENMLFHVVFNSNKITEHSCYLRSLYVHIMSLIFLFSLQRQENIYTRN